MSKVVEDFKEALKKYESEIGLGPVQSITATVEDAYPKHDEGVYTQSVVWVKYKDEWVVMFYGPNKWGEMYSDMSISPEEPESIHNDSCPIMYKVLEECETSIEELAEAIYWVDKILIDRVFDLTKVTDADIDLLEDTLERLKAARGVD